MGFECEQENLSEPVFLNVYGAQKSIPRNSFRHPCSLAGRYDNPIPTRFLAPMDCLKIPAQATLLINAEAESYATLSWSK